MAPPVPFGIDDAEFLRARLVRHIAHDVRDARVLDAMRRVPREMFILHLSVSRAYAEAPQPIGFGQTISEPTIVAVMTEALALTGEERVLEIGTGSGYQTAILSLLAKEVHSIEVIPELAQEASARLSNLGYRNAQVSVGDGGHGLAVHAPFDRILLTAACAAVPEALFEQLTEGGILVAPIGPSRFAQSLVRYRKHGTQIESEKLAPVRFVPMVKVLGSG